MTLHLSSRRLHRFAAIVAAGIAFAGAGALAGGTTDEQSLYLDLRRQDGPIALSGDGRWLAWVDGGEVLHRASVGDRSIARTLPLGFEVRELAASRTAQKVAFVAEGGCIGVVDFGADPAAVPGVRWRQVDVVPGRGPVADPLRWGPARPASCAVDPALPAESGGVALSADGRLLATADGVVDLDAGRVVLALPRPVVRGGRDTVLRLRFLERDTRLAVVAASFFGTEGGEGAPSRLQAAVWDVATGALWASAALADADFEVTAGQFADILPGGQLLWGDGTRRRAASDREAAPVDLVQWNAAGCATAPVRRGALQPWDWQAFVADPRGRWIAGMHKVERTGVTDELVVVDLASGRTVLQRAFRHEVHGWVAAADGATLFGLSAPSVRPGAGGPQPVGPVNSVGEVIEVAIPQAALAPASAPSPWSAAPCPAGNEAPGARAVEHATRAFAPAWTFSLAAEQDADAARGDCDTWCGGLFVRRDGSVWLDEGPRIVEIDAATGRVLRRLPTPRSAAVRSVPLPAADGFVNGQGDTLTWRPFEPVPGAAGRRVLDQRTGWQVLRLRRRGATVLAVWARKPDARTPRDPEGQPIFDAATYVLYDATGRRLSELPGHERCDGDPCGTEPLPPALLQQLAQPCHDERGGLADGLDWRAAEFDSLRAWACGPAPGAARLVLWDGVDASPKAARRPVDEDAVELLAHDGPLAVQRAGRRLHLFDAAARRELGQVAFAGTIDTVAVDAARGLVLVVGTQQEDDARRVLRAYRVR